MNARIMRGVSHNASFVDTTNIASHLASEPDMATTIVHAYAKASKFNVYNILQALTQGRGAVAKEGKSFKILQNNECQWPLKGQLTTAQPIVGPVQGNGIGGSTFIVPFPINYFFVGAVVRFEDGSLARIQEEPQSQGTKWLYKMQLTNPNPNATVSAMAIEQGRSVGWAFSAYEEASEGGGMVDDSPMWFKTQMGIVRTSQGLSGDAKYTRTVLQMKDKGVTSNLWMYDMQAKQLDAHWKQVEQQLWFSTYNRNQDGSITLRGKNGNVVQLTSGIEEQLQGINNYSVDELTEELFYQLATTISDHCGDSTNKNVLLVTGNGGEWEFNKAMKKESSRLSLVDTHFVSKVEGSELKFGAHYKSYSGPGGITFTIVNHPMFNRKDTFPGDIGPFGYTAQSYKMYFLFMGDMEGEENIQMITKGANGESRELIQWADGGSTNPTFGGSVNINMMRSHGGDYANLYTLSQVGVKIVNPMACGMIKITPPLR